MIELSLQPKQHKLLDLALDAKARVIGAGGGRGAAKSSGADRVALALMMEWPGCLGCIVMRNYDQVRRYHIEPIMRDFPVLDEYYARSDAKVEIPVGDGKVSQLDFSYAESLTDVERRFRSANYWFIIVDQAEQFSEQELREMRKACRRKGGGRSVFILLHNMGGVGIIALRKWFHTLEYNENESAEDYTFIKFNPWDNVEWVRAALLEDGLKPADYYSWTDDERREYAARRGEYTRQLASDDPAIAARDWLGSWEVLEGAYFGRVFDRQATMVSDGQVRQLIKPWDRRHLSQDWGKSHFNATYWHAVVTISPADALAILGWTTIQPLRAIVTYREMIVSEFTSEQVGREIIKRTPEPEREKLRDFWFSPEQFGERDSEETTAIKIGRELRKVGMPIPQPADNARVTGATQMYTLLDNTRLKGMAGSDCWLISSECPKLLEYLPMLMRDPKNLDDVLKTDKGQAKLEQDCYDGARYGVVNQLHIVKKPFSVALTERVESVAKEHGYTQANIEYLRMQQQHKQKQQVRFRRSYE